MSTWEIFCWKIKNLSDPILGEWHADEYVISFKFGASVIRIRSYKFVGNGQNEQHQKHIKP